MNIHFFFQVHMLLSKVTSVNWQNTQLRTYWLLIFTHYRSNVCLYNTLLERQITPIRNVLQWYSFLPNGHKLARVSGSHLGQVDHSEQHEDI